MVPGKTKKVKKSSMLKNFHTFKVSPKKRSNNLEWLISLFKMAEISIEETELIIEELDDIF